MTIKSQIKINQSPEKVWAFVTVNENWEKWNEATLKAVNPGWEKGATLVWERGEATLSDLITKSYIEISSRFMRNVYKFTSVPGGKTLIELEMTPLGGASFSDGGLAQTAKNDDCLRKLKQAVEANNPSPQSIPKESQNVKAGTITENMSMCPHCGEKLRGMSLSILQASMNDEEMVDFKIPCPSCGNSIRKKEMTKLLDSDKKLSDLSEKNVKKKWWEFWK